MNRNHNVEKCLFPSISSSPSSSSSSASLIVEMILSHLNLQYSLVNLILLIWMFRYKVAFFLSSNLMHVSSNFSNLSMGAQNELIPIPTILINPLPTTTKKCSSPFTAPSKTEFAHEIAKFGLTRIHWTPWSHKTPISTIWTSSFQYSGFSRFIGSQHTTIK